MIVLAPKSGVVSLAVRQESVVRKAERLASFSSREESLQAKKIDLAIQYVNTLVSGLNRR
jgi:hypothetical protein